MAYYGERVHEILQDFSYDLSAPSLPEFDLLADAELKHSEQLPGFSSYMDLIDINGNS